MCGGNVVVCMYWKIMVMNEMGYWRGGLERKKRLGYFFFFVNFVVGEGECV